MTEQEQDQLWHYNESYMKTYLTHLDEQPHVSKGAVGGARTGLVNDGLVDWMEERGGLVAGWRYGDARTHTRHRQTADSRHTYIHTMSILIYTFNRQYIPSIESVDYKIPSQHRYPYLNHAFLVPSHGVDMR